MAEPLPDYTYDARVLRVVDADTFEFEVHKRIPLLSLDFGFKFKVDLALTLRHEIRVRLADVDAWETRGAAERERGLAAKARVEELMPVGSMVRIQTSKSGKYNRYVATVELAGDLGDLGALLLDEGHAVPYGTKKKRTGGK